MASSNTLRVNAKQHKIEKVTVYQSNRAVIHRRFPIDFKVGQNEISIEYLPTSLESDSIRVETETKSATQALTVFDVVYTGPSYEQTSEDEDVEISKLEERHNALENRREILQKQVEILSSYANNLKGADTTAAQLGEFLDSYAVKREAIHKELVQIDKDETVIAKELSSARERSDSEQLAKKASTVTAVVLSEKEGTGDLVLSYVVYSASWRSLYDLRADVSSYFASGKDSRPSITLQYRASITQNTGEDWNGVILTLSTASPLLATQIPQLQPWHIDEPRPAPPVISPPPARPIVMQRSIARASALSQGALSPAYAPGAPAFSQMQSTAVYTSKAPEVRSNEGAVSSTFEVEGFSTIPSDDSSHKVSIATLDLHAELEYVVVPRTSPSAFLQCRVKNTSGFLLIAGPSSVFMDGNFVSKSQIPNVSPQETFFSSLGIDPSIRVTYHPQTKSVRTSGGSIISMSTKSEITSFSQRISIKNTRSTKLSRLVVKDLIPISQASRVRVSILQPSEKDIGPLDPAALPDDSRKGQTLVAHVSSGVAARWAQKNDENGGSGGSKGDGVLEWICSEVGETLELTLAYEVSAPQGVKWASV